jgi:HAD superfamily hydrolase (TIGR01509 family)
MTKLIIFDLDGVLVKAKEIHFQAFNIALIEVGYKHGYGDKFALSWNEHLSLYDGLKTTRKLELISKNKGLPLELHTEVWDLKQKITIKLLSELNESSQLKECLNFLSLDGYKLAVCSNSIRKTVLTVLAKLGIIQYFDLIVSNEDVLNSKPHPEMYWKVMSEFKVIPSETLIIEDSPNGLLAAYMSRANILRVKSPDDISYETISNKLKQKMNTLEKPKWSDKKLNVLIPMAGAGTRFEKAGYSFPKPLIDVNGKPMIQVVVESLNMDANFIYIVQKSHREKYNLDTLLKLITPNCSIIETDGLTEGAACTALLAKDLINNDNPLFFANSDQYVDWDSSEFMYKMQETSVDGGIVTFKSTHPKWSFAKLNEFGFITEVAEKNPISDNATVGYYFWKNGSDFVKYAESMINKNIRVNNEFYVCPVFNEAIADGKKISSFEIEKMWGLGTPEDLKYFLENYK